MSEIKISTIKNTADTCCAVNMTSNTLTSKFDWSSCTATAVGSLQESSVYISKAYFKNFKMPGNFKVFIDEKQSGFRLGEVYIKEVIYNDPATIVLWSDGSKTTSKVDSLDVYNPEFGLLICVLKKLISGDAVADLLEHWTPALTETVNMGLFKKKPIHKTFTEVRQKFNKIWKAQKKSKKKTEAN